MNQAKRQTDRKQISEILQTTDKVLGVTGHRKCNYSESLGARVKQFLSDYNPALVIVGMAPGFDTIVATIAHSMGLKLLLAQPYAGALYSTSFWESLKEQHLHIMVNSGPFSAIKLISRNHYIVRNSKSILAYLKEQNTGTGHAVSLAKGRNIPVTNIYRASHDH